MRGTPGRLLLGIDASRSFRALPTGTEQYATQVTRRLVERSGHHCRLYLRDRPAEPLPDQADTRILRCPRLWTHTCLATELWRHPPDVLFVPAHVIPLVCRVPSVVTVHDLGYLAYPDAHPPLQRAYLRWTTWRHARVADHLIADSGATRDDLVRRHGVDAGRITVVHLGVEATMRPASAGAVADVRRRFGIGPDRVYLLHVGTLQPRKNLMRLTRAFAGLAAQHESVDLVLAGQGGWGADDIQGLSNDLGLAHRVRVLGYVSRDDLPALYTGAAAVVIPSLYEGFGLTAIEGMACGAPVAASRSSSLIEVVGDAGLLFDPLDVDAIARALGLLLSTPALRAQMSAAGLLWATRFNWDRCADETLAVIEDVARHAV